MKKITKRILSFLALFTMELVLVWAAFLVSFIVFAVIVKEIFIQNEHELDYKAFDFLADYTTPALTDIMIFITFFGTKDFLFYASLFLILLFMFMKKHVYYSLKVIVIAFGSTLLNQLLKLFFERERPVTQMLEMPGLSFPSGHAMIGLSFYGILIYWVWTNVKSKIWRWMLCLSLLLWSILVGLSRVYLQVHYLTDVIAGFAAGLLWLIVSILLLKKFERRYFKPLKPLMDEENGLNGSEDDEEERQV